MEAAAPRPGARPRGRGLEAEPAPSIFRHIEASFGSHGRRRPRDPPAPHSHLIAFPEALEAFFTRVGELKVVLGPRAAAGVDGLEALIQEGLAARDRGDRATALRRIVQAMERLAELAGASDAAEAPMLRAMAQQFAAALGARRARRREGRRRDDARALRQHHHPAPALSCVGSARQAARRSSARAA